MNIEQFKLNDDPRRNTWIMVGLVVGTMALMMLIRDPAHGPGGVASQPTMATTTVDVQNTPMPTSPR